MRTGEFHAMTESLAKLTPHQRGFRSERLRNPGHIQAVGALIESRTLSTPICPKCGHDHLARWQPVGLWSSTAWSRKAIPPKPSSPPPSSLSDFGIAGCKPTATAHFSPDSCPIVRLCGGKSGKNCTRRGRFSLTTTKARQAARKTTAISSVGSHDRSGLDRHSWTASHNK